MLEQASDVRRLAKPIRRLHQRKIRADVGVDLCVVRLQRSRQVVEVRLRAGICGPLLVDGVLRNRDRGENADDRHHHQELDQREAVVRILHSFHFLHLRRTRRL